MNALSSPASWLMRQSGDARQFRLYCFSHAGGNAASYLPWQARVDRAIEICAIQLPGHGLRLNEEPQDSMPVLIEELAQIIATDSNLPFAFFGHSLGGLLAFELARYCRRNSMQLPAKLFVSGCAAPQHRGRSRDLHLLPNDDLIKALEHFNGTPPQVLQHRRLMSVLLPAIRADFALVERYHYRPEPPLDLPIAVLVGRQDEIDSLDQIHGWGLETTSACNVHWFEGGHFFVQSHADAVLNCLATEFADIQWG